jgi:hypothetical protein
MRFAYRVFKVQIILKIKGQKLNTSVVCETFGANKLKYISSHFF